MSAHNTSELEVAHQFEDFEQQTESYTVGMWIFLATEILFFGGLFAAYIVYKNRYPEAFLVAHEELDVVMGGINTMLLLTSSLTMALAVRCSMLNLWKAQMRWLFVTILFALGFMVVKYFEYSSKYEHHLIPGANFEFHGAYDRGAEIFFSLYFSMTGLHGIHVLVGIIAISTLMVRTYLMRKRTQDFIPVELTGLYWHFVDIVWIFLYPILYLIGR